MGAGRELDALVAKHVMGWDALLIKLRDKRLIPLPAYSTSISDAWEVAEKLSDLGWYTNIERYTRKNWRVTLDKFVEEGESDDNIPSYGWSDTAPHAICLAALKAVGVEL